MEEIIFPNQIRTFRRLKGITMQQLADFLNLSLSAISKIEKGYRRIDQDQLLKLSQYLDCSAHDIFVNENTASPEILQIWRKEQERRSKINEGGGLRILGAGLRYIRTQQKLTLIDVAEAFGMTLSVYHRIEVGQREADEEEFTRIARALGYTSVELQKEIYELNRSGRLKEFMPHTDSKFQAGPKGGLPGQDYRFDNYRSDKHTISIKIYGAKQETNDSFVTLNLDNVLGTCFCPSAYVTANTYAIAYPPKSLKTFSMPDKSLIVVDQAKSVAVGDLAIYYKEENKVLLVTLMEDKEGKLYFQSKVDKKMNVELDEVSESLHKVVQVIMP